VNYDVPGNIHYGWVGRAASFPRWLLLYAAHKVQKGGVDDPKDQNAIKFGMDFFFLSSIIKFKAGDFVAKKAINISKNLVLMSANLKEKQQ